jgi:hypothetical protein
MTLTLDELANLYDKHTGKKARIQPIDNVIDWAVSRKDLFYVDKDDNICLRED